MHNRSDEKYLNILLNAIWVCAQYRPKLGRGRGEGYSLEAFQELYQADPFYHWLGLDNPLMYAAHKAAGGMTSVYRQIGIGAEHLFRAILQDQLGLKEADSKWSYKIPAPGRTKPRTHHRHSLRSLSLDGRIPLESVTDALARERISTWILQMATSLDVEQAVAQTLTGAVFEVRQGYKSKDSKRQNADLANAATAYTRTYLPCVVLLSSQIDTDIMYRYRGAKWGMLIGVTHENNPTTSTYEFLRSVIGYDLAAFFERNSDTLRREVATVLEALLRAES